MDRTPLARAVLFVLAVIGTVAYVWDVWLGGIVLDWLFGLLMYGGLLAVPCIPLGWMAARGWLFRTRLPGDVRAMVAAVVLAYDGFVAALAYKILTCDPDPADLFCGGVGSLIGLGVAAAVFAVMAAVQMLVPIALGGRKPTLPPKGT